jgi:hypothetical protein
MARARDLYQADERSCEAARGDWRGQPPGDAGAEPPATLPGGPTLPGRAMTSALVAAVKAASALHEKRLGTIMSRRWAVRREAGCSGTGCADDA